MFHHKSTVSVAMRVQFKSDFTMEPPNVTGSR